MRFEKVSENETLLAVAGPLFGEAGADFEKKIDSLTTINSVLITLDLSMAIGITSSAIGKLVAIHKKLAAQNRRIRIVGCNETLFKTFKMIKLDTLMEIAP
ncbi:MAG TPA: STAS domain-containing protein [Spirochaetia bacterium]|nr:STAS domain-containing protein [Spirochaetia bacterium]